MPDCDGRRQILLAEVRLVEAGLLVCRPREKTLAQRAERNESYAQLLQRR